MFRKMAFLFVTCSLLWVIVPSPMADTLHAVVVANTNDWQTGASFRKDLSRIKELAGTISSHTQLTLRFYEISGNHLTRNKVTSTLEKLPIESNDVVIFHYAGHGGRASNKSSPWPSMDIDGGALDLDRVKSMLEDKKPRFLIILADTCNNFDDSLSPVWSRRGGSSRGTSSSEGYRQLFLNYRGHVFAFGAKPGQSSWGNSEHGGFFTEAFLNSLNKDLASSNPNWYAIMKRAEAPIEVNGTVQNPQSKVDITPVHAGIVEPIPDQCYYFYKPNGVLCCKTSKGTSCDNEQSQQEEACPPGGLFMKPGGITCCRRPTGITCN